MWKTALKVKRSYSLASFFSAKPGPGMLQLAQRDPMKLLKSRAFKVLLSLLLAAGLCWLVLRQVNPADVGRRIAAASPAWLLVSAALSMGAYVIRAWRWVWILKPVGAVTLGDAYYATAVGFAGNFLPARAGEIIRPAVLARDSRLPFSALLASILFERLLDAASVFFFLGLAFLDPPWGGSRRSSGPPVAVGTVPLAVLAAIVVLSYLAVFRRVTLEKVADRLLLFCPSRWRVPARAAFSAFLDGLALVRDLTPGQWGAVLGTSLSMWFIINLQIACVVKAFGIGLPLSASYVLTFAAVLGLAVPTPAGIGGYHAAVTGALEQFGVARDTALGAATLAHAVSFGPIALMALALLFARSIRGDPRGNRDNLSA
jgi:uncharacterized protein (TIRG00374 family)